MKKLVLSSILGLSLLALPMVAQTPADHEDKAAGEYKKSGTKLKSKSKEAGHELKEGEVAASGKDIGKGTGSAAKHAAKGTAEGAKAVGEGTKEVAEKAGDETAKGAKKVGHGLKKAVDPNADKKP